MRLKPGKHLQRLPRPAGGIVSVYAKVRGVMMPLTVTGPGQEELAKQLAACRPAVADGIPIVCVPCLESQELAVYPAPAKAYELVVRYHPPIEEQ